MSAGAPYPSIADYAVIGDCHSAALVSRDGSIDFCCIPRFDAGAYFARLLDWEQGGFCRVAPRGGRTYESTRRYLDGTLILETTFRTRTGEARLLDCFAMRRGGRDRPHNQLLRIVDGVQGHVDFVVDVAPRFDFCEVLPWIRRHGLGVYSAIGGHDGLLIAGEMDLAQTGTGHQLRGRFTVHAGERRRLSLQHVLPQRLDTTVPDPPGAEELDRRLAETTAWWHRWAAGARTVDGLGAGPDTAGAFRSATVLKALTNAPTGAMVAAVTTSLPESPGGSRNWDYRFSWVRDSAFAVRALAELGHDAEADGFRRFVERSAAGSAHELQIMYGLGGERRLGELQLDHLAGYRGARPVRLGNAAYAQSQLDVYGWLLDLAWLWHERGHSPDDDYWRFLVDLVNAAAVRWREKDRGIWEVRGAPNHFVHSKVMCWVALDRGLRLARESARRAPTRRWAQARREIRDAVETEGYDARRGVFTQAFGRRAMDSALLLLPAMGFVEYDDERMIRTTEAVRQELDRDGLLLRYAVRDGLDGDEGAFVACTFWLATCLARQGRAQEAREAFDRAMAASNDLGLFSEEYDPRTREMLGNFPQGLTHLSHIAAAIALAETESSGAR